jgi:hypothetical protein
MIPTIEDILRDVACGEMSYKTALAYINQHMEMAGERQADSDMRDHFAAMALSTMSVGTGAPERSYIARNAYLQADAMLVARAKPQP